MSIEVNKAVVQRFGQAVGEFWRTGDANALDGLLAEGFVDHTPGMPPDREGCKQMLPMYRAAFPELEISLEDIVAEGDRVSIRSNVAQHPPGRADRYLPDERPANVTKTHIYRIEDGKKVVERWGEFDRLGLMRQIGGVPQQGRAQLPKG
jgi:predicted ester cyclase